jgi:hypothetical protein
VNAAGQVGCYCWWPPKPIAERGKIHPRYLITHVVYAPPGRSSSVQYQNGSTVGSTMSVTDSMKHNLDTSFGVSGGFLGSEGGLSVSVGNAWGGSSSKSVDVALTHTSVYRKPGQQDAINHDDDEIWFLANPELAAIATPDSPYGPAKITWHFDPEFPGVPFFLRVGELKGTEPIEPGIQAALDYWGITPEDYPEMLKADPFSNGAAPNAPMDPARFDLISVFPYEPLPSAGAQPAPQTYTVTRRQVNTSERRSDATFSQSVKVSGTLGFLGIAKSFFSVSAGASFTMSSANRTSTESNTSDSVTVGQPAFGYTGPVVLRVYEDKIWKTLVFTLDWY